MTATDTVSSQKVKVATWSELEDRKPAYALVANVDLVVIRFDDQVSVLYGRCLHRGALLADGKISGQNLICGVHGWDYRWNSGISEYKNEEALHKFNAWVDADDDAVYVDEFEIRVWEQDNPQPYDRESYQGLYADIHGVAEEPHNHYVQELARNGQKNFGRHGQVSAMGVALTDLPRWDDIQILTGQLARKPMLDDAPVGSELVIGPNAKKPLTLDIPLFVSDMSFGALSREAKTALSKGAEMAGTGICSGEGGMLPAEQENNSRYFYELASARFGWSLDKVARCQAFHFKGGRGRRQAPAATFRVIKLAPRSRKSGGSSPERRRSAHQRFLILSHRRTIAKLRMRSGMWQAGFQLGSRYRRSISRLTSTSRSRSASTISSSTAAEEPREQPRSFSRTTYRFRRWPLWRGHGVTSTCAGEAT